MMRLASPLLFILFVFSSLSAQETVLSYNVSNLPITYGKCKKSVTYTSDGKSIEHDEISNAIDASKVDNGIIYINFTNWTISHNTAADSDLIINPFEIKINPAGAPVQYMGQRKAYVINPLEGGSVRIPFRITGNGDCKVTIPFYIKKIKQNAFSHVQLNISNASAIAKTDADKEKASTTEIAKTGKDTQTDNKLKKETQANTNKSDIAKLGENLKKEIKKAPAKNDKSKEGAENNLTEEVKEVNALVSSIALPGRMEYTIQLENMENPMLGKAPSILQIDDSKLLIKKELKASVDKEGKYRIHIMDTFAGINHQILLDNNFRADLKKVDDVYKVDINGGIPPYRVVFNNAETDEENPINQFADILPKDGKYEFTAADLVQKGMEGSFNSMSIFDSRAKEKLDFPIDVKVYTDKAINPLFYIIPIALLLFGGLIVMIRKQVSKKKKKEFAEKAEKYQKSEEIKVVAEDLEAAVPEAQIQTATTAIPSTTRVVQEASKKLSIQKRDPKNPKFVRTGSAASGAQQMTKRNLSASKFKIKAKGTVGGRKQTNDFFNLVNSPAYQNINLGVHWDDSRVTNVHVNDQFIKNLTEFLKRENLDRIHVEKLGLVPEVGGFLMGNFVQDEKDSNYQIAINKFVPFIPEYHDLYKIEIGTATLVQELGDAQDKFPDQSVIGWFHTHPGHGLFLSNADLAVHKQFSQPYQLAMEIDSLTDRLDTAFFTWNSGGWMNNVENLVQNTKWFTWKEIQKH